MIKYAFLLRLDGPPRCQPWLANPWASSEAYLLDQTHWNTIRGNMKFSNVIPFVEMGWKAESYESNSTGLTTWGLKRDPEGLKWFQVSPQRMRGCFKMQCARELSVILNTKLGYCTWNFIYWSWPHVQKRYLHSDDGQRICISTSLATMKQQPVGSELAYSPPCPAQGIRRHWLPFGRGDNE